MMKSYIPAPIDLSDVELDDDLNELREAIAENAHEVWAQKRMSEGWSFGKSRNDVTKQTPDMVPYAHLTDSEQSYDREMAMNTLKLLKKLGYDLVKREDTELYRFFISKLRGHEEVYHCSACGGLVLKHQVFCDHCGIKLNMDYNS